MTDTTTAATPPAEAPSPEMEVIQNIALGPVKVHETEDEILDRLLGADSRPAEEKPAEPAAEPNTEVPSDSTPDAEGLKAEEPRPAEESTPSPELDTALKSLRQAGFSTEDLTGMTDERLLEIGAKQAKMQKDSQEHVRSLTAELKAAKESQPEIKTDSTGEFAELASEETVAKIREGMKPLAEDFGWEDKHVDALTDSVSKTVQRAIEPLRAELEAAKAQTERANTAAFQALFDNARRQLGERIPRLRDDAVFKEKVEPKLAQLDIKSYGSVDDILIDAARMAGLRIYKTAEEAKSQAQELSQAKANGKPTTESRGTAPESMNADEKMDDLLNYLIDEKGTGAEWKRGQATR